MPDPTDVNQNGNGNQAQNTTGQLNNTSGTSTNNNANQTSNSEIDYSKIQEMIDGRNAKTEDAVLKSYFQKQGLSEEEMQSAIESFKASKAQKLQEQNQNFINLQKENDTLKAQKQELQIENRANQIGLEFGVEAKTIPYLIKMADLSGAVDKDGKISDDAIKTAFNDVLEALPQLKNPVQENNKGFQKIGGGNDNNQPNVDEALKEIFS